MGFALRRLVRLDVALAALLALLLVYLTLLLTVGSPVLPFSTASDRADAQINAVKKAAQNEVVAYFSIDYQHLDTWQKGVLAGATGTFHDEFQSVSENTKAAVFAGKVTSTGQVLQTSLSSVGGGHAVVFAAANLTEKGDTTSSLPASPGCGAGAACHRYFLKIELEKVGDVWKVSNLGVAS